jgi:hypothetical protein
MTALLAEHFIKFGFGYFLCFICKIVECRFLINENLTIEKKNLLVFK